MVKLFGAIWTFVFYLISILFVYSLIIYGFDISLSKGGRKHALISMVTNTSSDYAFYAIDENYGFGIREEEEFEEFAVDEFSAYGPAEFPLCLTCGYYKKARGVQVWGPYMYGSFIYSVNEPYEEDEGYEVFNMKSNEVFYVDSLTEIAPDAADPKYKVTRDYIRANGKAISFRGPSDYDCVSTFTAVFVMYGLLIFYAIPAFFIRRRMRRKRGE